MKENAYRDNQEPKIGDRVKFQSGDDQAVYVVTSVQGGRLGNKIGVVSEANQKTMAREYYYYCFVKA